MIFFVKTIVVIGLMLFLSEGWAESPKSLSNNEAIKYCWDKHNGGFNNGTMNAVFSCANSYMVANQRLSIQKTRDFLREHPEYRDGRRNSRLRIISTRPIGRG